MLEVAHQALREAAMLDTRDELACITAPHVAQVRSRASIRSVERDTHEIAIALLLLLIGPSTSTERIHDGAPLASEYVAAREWWERGQKAKGTCTGDIPVRA